MQFAGALVRMTFRVFVEVMPYLLLLLIVILGLANAFFVMFSELPPPEDGAYQSFSSDDRFPSSLFGVFHVFMLGEAESALALLEETPDRVPAKLLFVAGSILVTTFMLNLLISLLDSRWVG